MEGWVDLQGGCVRTMRDRKIEVKCGWTSFIAKLDAHRKLLAQSMKGRSEDQGKSSRRGPHGTLPRVGISG